jgi:outer membrane receptor protein involved in Fe transport
VQNVFNQRSQVPAGDDGTLDTIPQPGRVFYLRASYRF